MTTRWPRTVQVAASALFAALLGRSAYALIQAGNQERKDAARRFAGRAGVSAALTESLFSSVERQGGTISGEGRPDECAMTVGSVEIFDLPPGGGAR